MKRSIVLALIRTIGFCIGGFAVAATITTKTTAKPAAPTTLLATSSLPRPFGIPGGANTEQTTSIGTSAVVTSINQAPATNSCFAYYSFGSVQATISSQTPVTTVGAPLSLTATIVNSNDYPVINGALYIKVFKNRPDGADINGPAVVDEFFATDSLDIAAHTTVSVPFVYNIPGNAVTGEYQIGTYFTASKKFNLSGLSFTDDVVGSYWSFSVRSGQDGVIEFDKDKVTVASSTYRFASYPPRVSKNQFVDIRAPIKNSTDKGQIVSIEWTTYSWDAQLTSNIIATSTQTLLIGPHATSTANYFVTNNAHPVYLVVGTLTYRDTKSIVNIRFVRDGVDEARLNFPAVTSFPLQSGVPVTLFSCFYNSGLANLLPPHTLDLKLVDSSGHTIEDYSVRRPVTGAMALAKILLPQKASYDNFTLNATLTDYQGKIVDQASIHYDCKAIDPKLM